MAEWQDIATAPKDGTSIIGASFGRYGDLQRVWWQEEFGAWIKGCNQMSLAPGLTFEDGTSKKLHSPQIQEPTHWLPLPPEPPQ